MPKFFSGYISIISIATIAVVATSSALNIKTSKIASTIENIVTTSTTTLAEVQTQTTEPAKKSTNEGKHVLVNLNKMILELHDGDDVIKTIPVVSIGKPGSYYETIGGHYLNDYKEQSHFSSIGHVYMPWSIHVFGNFFIHGIPYHEDGERVSSTYSGGCVRLADDDAKVVYDFISRNTPIIITRGEESDFEPTNVATSNIESMEMTRTMVATVSLEFLTQDNEIVDTDGISTTTRRTLIPRLLKGDDDVSMLYARYLGEKMFVAEMNAKAKSLGLSNTTFTSVKSPAITSDEDLKRFTDHISVYGSYLNNVARR